MTHRRGAEIRSVVIRLVTADSSPAGIAARASHRSRSRPVTPTSGTATVGSAAVRFGGGSFGACGLRLGFRGRPEGRSEAEGRERDDHREHREPHAPPGPLGRETQPRLDDQRVGEEGDQRSSVAERVEPVRVAGVGARIVDAADARVPGRDQRGGGGHRERGGPDDDQQDREEPWNDREVGAIEGCHRPRRRDGRDEGHDHQADVQRCAATRVDARREQVRVQVAQEQDGLEEHQDGRPDRRCAAEHGQDEPPHHRLRREQEERREADRTAEDERRREPAGDGPRDGPRDGFRARGARGTGGGFGADLLGPLGPGRPLELDQLASSPVLGRMIEEAARVGNRTIVGVESVRVSRPCGACPTLGAPVRLRPPVAAASLGGASGRWAPQRMHDATARAPGAPAVAP